MCFYSTALNIFEYNIQLLIRLEMHMRQTLCLISMELRKIATNKVVQSAKVLINIYFTVLQSLVFG